MFIFCHANGFPPDSYLELLKQIPIKPHTILLAPLKRKFSPLDQKKNWNHFGDEMMEEIKNHIKNHGPVVGVGHSMGAIMLLRAAVLEPSWFKKLILIDPTFLPETFVYASNYLPRFINRKIHPVASKAYRRRDTWNSKQEAFDGFRNKRLFSKISDEGLWNYVNSVITEQILNDGSTSAFLNYSKQWEEHCFLSVINIWPLLKRCHAPIVGITGEKSELMTPKIIIRWKKIQPTSEIHTLKNCGHLVAFEKPKECAEIIKLHLD